MVWLNTGTKMKHNHRDIFSRERCVGIGTHCSLFRLLKRKKGTPSARQTTEEAIQTQKKYEKKKLTELNYFFLSLRSPIKHIHLHRIRVRRE